MREMDQKVIYLVIIVAVCNYLLRMVPVVVLSKVEIPKPLERFLNLTPCAVIAVMVAVGVFTPEQKVDFSLDNIYLLASVPTFAVALHTRSLGWTLLAGMLVVALLRFCFC